MNRWSAGMIFVVGVALCGPSGIETTTRGEELRSDPSAYNKSAAATPAKPTRTPADSESSHEIPRELPAKDQPARVQYVLDFARDAYARITKDVRDYDCQLVKRERVNGELGSYQYLYVKVRHEQKSDGKVVVPLSVYLRFLKPERMEGREVLYVANANQGDLIARRGGRRSPNVTIQLPPDSPMAMDGNRYPITEIGFENLTRRLIEVLEQEQKHNDGVIEIFPNAKIDGRKCTHFRLTHPQRRADLTYYMAEVSVDNELKVPVYFRSFDWPAEEGGKPRLLEEYFYKQVRINIGLTDQDFDRDNPEYHFQPLDDTGVATGDTKNAGDAKDADDEPGAKESDEPSPGTPAGIPVDDTAHPNDDK